MEKKVTKLNLSTLFLILAILVIIVMSIFMFKLYNEKMTEVNKSTELQSQVNILNEKLTNLQEKINKISETVNENSPTQTNSSNNSETTNNTASKVTYSINTKDGIFATITATKNDKTVTKEFEMSAEILNTGTMELPTLGTVALVADSGGEYCGVSIYQLVGNEIKLVGTINCGADMVKDATYTVTNKNENTAIINAKINNETISKEFEMSTTITNTSIIDIFNFGKVVLISETEGENSKTQVYRLSKDYTTGKITEIKNVGSIQ